MFATTHKIVFGNSKDQSFIDSESVDLVVTSPPYPMIEMWDEIFSSQDKRISDALVKYDGSKVFELMHQAMDPVWKELFRVLKNGGFACINIGDATRTINENFALYPNHARIISSMMSLGFTPLPDIIWRKQTNAPNKFMGSGMLPAGAYVTFEHEYILIFRKGSKRDFSNEADKERRKESAYFWEERNSLFSDVWFDIKGTVQSMKKSEARSRSAAFPFELAYRLIAMYSAKGDTVLDPFMGTGTTMHAAMASARNSIGFEIDKNLRDEIFGIKDYAVDFSNKYINDRLERHVDFVQERLKRGKEIKHVNSFYDFPVITNQEKNLLLNELKDVRFADENSFEVSYSKEPGRKFSESWAVDGSETKSDPIKITPKGKKEKNDKYKAGKGQMNLW